MFRPSSGDVNIWAAITRAAREAWFGQDVSGTAQPPLLRNNEYLTSTNAAGTGVVNIAKVDANNNVIFAAGSQGGGAGVLAISVTATLAQVNAGLTLVAGVAGLKVTPISFREVFAGNWAACTDIRISTTDGSPVDITTVTQAAATDGAVFVESVPGATGLTVGAGFGVQGTAGQGIQVRKTGNAATTGTSVNIIIKYLLGS